MDIMLIYPPLTVEERYGRKVGKGVGGNLPPLGIATLAAYVRECGFEPDVVDGVGLDLTTGQLFDRVAQVRPKVVGFSALTMTFYRALQCADQIRARFPDTLVLIGGHHATIMTQEIAQENACFDLVVYGEGELTLLEILDRYKALGYDRKAFMADAAGLAAIRGIAYRSPSGPVVNPPRELIRDLDALPYPARDLLPMDRYIPLPNQYLRRPVVHMTAIRGCPFACSFCSNNAVFGRNIRARTPARVVDEIEYVKKEYHAREISFWDDTMTVNRKWMEEFCDELIRRNTDVTWTGYARVDTVDLPLLKKMKAAGCWNLFYGFESGDQSLLDIIAKNITLDDCRKACQWTKEAGIEVRGSFMLALPGETPELARRTINFAKELNPDYAQFTFTTPFPGTQLWVDAKKYGSLDADFRNYYGWTSVFVPHGYESKEQIIRLQSRAMKEFYLRPAFIWQCLRKIRTWDDVKRYTKGFRFLLGFV